MAIDWRARRGGDDPLDTWEVLAEEFETEGVSLGGALDEVAENYFATKSKLDQEKQKDPEGKCNKCLANAQAEFDKASRAVDEVLFPIFHAHPRTALCFSGGGVRSATFGLGVLHALAKLEPSPLPKFDFLSTVSGGGYLGGWFSAWAARKEREDPSEPGAKTVRDELAKAPPLPSTLDPEPAPLLHIRRYCRFLNPQMGLLSADTWALVATVARNMILNWLILVPLLMAALLIPVLYVSVVLYVSTVDMDNIEMHWIGVWIALVAGMLSGVVGTTYIACHLPTLSGTKKGGQTGFLKWVLMPLGISAIFLSLHWVWRLQLPPHNDYAFYQFMAIGAAIHGLGGLFGAIKLRSRAIKAPWKTIFILIAAAASGAVAGWLAYLFAQLLLTPSQYVWQRFACLAVPFVLLAFSVAALLTVGIASQVTDDEDREWWSRAGGWLLILTVVWLVFSASVLFLPNLLQQTAARLAAAVSTLGIGGIASRLGFSGSTAASGLEEEKSRQKNTSTTKDLIAKFAGPLFLLMLVGVLGIVNISLIDSLPAWAPWLPGVTQPLVGALYVLFLFGLAVLAFSWPININRFSLHAMYRARLVRTYLGASRPDRKDTVNQFTDLDEADNLPLICLSKNKPLHIVNMALNLVGGKNLAWQQRKAESFTASRLRTGSVRLGYQDSGKYAKRGGVGKGLTLGSAITISGAAASPNMGYHSSPILSFVMTLFNARLGWWLANPGPKGKGKWQEDGPTISFMPIIDEALGRTNDESTWVYLSDGGHFENLGIYEMILRRCKTIAVVDGSQDNTYTFEDLGNAVRKARVDLGVPIDFGSGLPMYGARDVRNRYCAMGKILYHCVDGAAAEDGTIIYIKACLNGSEPADVLHYASSDSEFPQQGTEELWFDESQFESYRRLGSHIVEKIWEKNPAAANSPAAAIEQFVAAAEKYIAARPEIKFIGWPKPSQFVGSAIGTLATNTGPTDVKLTMDLEQM